MREDVYQQRSKQIAAVLGPTLIAVSVSEALNLSIWETSLPQVVYLNGMIFFMGGIAIVRFHNRWRPAWTVPITLVGWALVGSGLFRLFFPNATQASASPATYAFIGGLGLVGLFLSFKAYR